MPRRGKFRAPRAFQSSLAGSSREGQSCVPVLCSPSLDQGNCLPQAPNAGSSQEGNCLPQAPSASQSSRVGSSQERPTSYLTALLPQATSVSQSPSLDQPLVETVGQGCYRRLAPSTRQLLHCNLDEEMHVLYSNIQSVVEGRLKKFWYGWTSLETPLSNEREFFVSIHPCGSRNEAPVYSSLAQDECKTDRTVKFHFLHGFNIVIERVQADVHSWIDNKYAYWRQNGKHKSSWWDHIRDDFIQIFRNVMVCLCHTYSKRIYIDGISVINNRKTKLSLFVKAATEEEFNNGSRKDIIDLRQLMVEAVLKKYYIKCNARDCTKEQAAIYFSKEGLPNDLCHFIIGRLYDENFVPINLDWLLDDPAFWSPDLKLRFFRDLYEIVHDRQLMDTGYASVFLSEKLEQLKITNWERLIPEWGPERNVLLRKMREDQKLHNKEDRGSGGSRQSRFMGKEKVEGKGKEKTSGSEGNKFTETDIFWDILQFCRNLIEHYNYKLPHHERKEKIEISLIADKLFNGACSMLRNSIFEAWMAQPSSSNTGRPEYMDMLMTGSVINRRQV